MNIGFDAKRYFHNKTGLGNYSRDLIRILTKYNTNNKIFLYNPKKIDINKLKYFVNVFEKNPNSIFLKKMSFIWRLFFIKKEIIKDKIQIYHGLSGELPFGMKSLNIKTVVTIHDLIFIRYPKLYSFFDRQIHNFKFKNAVNKADIIIAISQQTKNDIIKYFKINEDKIKIIYQTCDNSFKIQYSNYEKKIVQTKYNLPEKFILNVGTIEERKNAFTIVKSIKDINIDLIFIGKQTKYSNKIKKYIFENNLTTKVHFLKNVSQTDLAIIYQLSTIFIYPSIFEGFGIPIIEALYSKTPVITNKYGVFNEVAGPNSIYINPFDYFELAEKINLILNNNEIAENMKTKGYEYVQKFNDLDIYNKYQQIYSDLFNSFK